MDTTAEPTTPPAPPQDERTKPVPPFISDVLLILHILLVYGRHLTQTLERRRQLPGFSNVAQFFGTARLAPMLARVARGLLRIQALQRVLLDRARRGRDLIVLQPRKRPDPSAQPQAAQQPGQQRIPRRRRPDPDAIPDPDSLPTLEQLVAEIRRRGIGRTLADICHDLGVAPELCDYRFSRDLLDMIQWYGDRHMRFLVRFYHRTIALDSEPLGDRHPSLPERDWDAMQRKLGFAIGERWPVMPVFLPATPIAHAAAATGPP